jgi:hypothetical protein
VIIGLFADPWPGLADAPISFRHPLLLWRKAIWFKANPRSAAYMRERLAERWPNAFFVDASASAWAASLTGADTIVLLYPDAIGIGFAGIERQVRVLAPRARIEVLNGRRRSFALDGRTRFALALRRFLERSMLTEIFLGAALLLATPFLLAADFLAGRR